jgi:TRAP transporter TAXI family solute receptor
MTKLRIGTSEADSTFHRQAIAIGEVWRTEKVADEVEALTTSGSVDNAEMVARGDAEYGCMAANWLPLAATGKPPFKAALPVALATPINSGAMFFTARAESGLTRFIDLRGKKVALGVANSGMVQHFHGILRALNLTLGDFEPIYVGAGEGAKMLAEGKVDAQFQPPIPNIAFNGLIAKTKIRMLSFSEQELGFILGAVPYYAEATVRKGTFPGHDADMKTIAVVNILSVNRNTAEDGVYKAVSSVIRNADDLAKKNPLFVGLSDLLAQAGKRIIPVLARSGALQHPGAAKAFREAGLSG